MRGDLAALLREADQQHDVRVNSYDRLAAFLSARGVVVLDRTQLAVVLHDSTERCLGGCLHRAAALIAALTGPTASTPVRQPSPSGFVSTEGEDQAATAPYRGLSTEADLLAVTVGTVITGPDWHEEVYLKTDADEWCPPDPEAAWTSKSLVARGPFSVALTGPAALGQPCRECGNNYRIGDDGCRHGAAAQQPKRLVSRPWSDEDQALGVPLPAEESSDDR